MAVCPREQNKTFLRSYSHSSSFSHEPSHPSTHEFNLVNFIVQYIYTFAGYMYYPRNPPVGLSLSFLLSQPSLIGPSVVVLSLLLAYSHSPTLQGVLTPMGIILNLLPNSGGDTSFWVVALAILMTSPPPSPP